MRQVAHVLLTRPPLNPFPKELHSLDLHVLGTPPAFVLSQDQTLRKYLRSAFSKLFCSLKNCSVALFLKHWIYFAWLFNFQRTPAASRRQLIYNTTVGLLCQHFFKSFLETFEVVFFTCRLWLSALAND